MKNFLIKHEACKPAQVWAEGKTTQEIITLCHRGDWLLWLANECKLDERKRVLAAGRCAATVKHLMKDPRSLKALEVAELYGLGIATEEELEVAGENARAAAGAAWAAAWAAARAAAGAAWAAAGAARAAAWDAADAAADAADGAAWAAAADAAELENQLTTANICREIFGQDLLNYNY